MDEKEAHELLGRCLYGVLSTVCSDGQPYAVPISYGYDGTRIVLHCAADVGQKLENLRADARVCFTVVGDVETLPGKFSTLYESVVVLGTANQIEDSDEKKEALHLLIDKYSGDFQERGTKYINGAVAKTCVIEIAIDQITGKARRA
ncbi:MAG: pyridoxamine 5'-phosphate oxidase family protein [Eggerthellaceae bacterium]|nr:pyridoxamine 5'-phosphate oxidase family protein [Eggerthellaceae bacterium]